MKVPSPENFGIFGAAVVGGVGGLVALAVFDALVVCVACDEATFFLVLLLEPPPAIAAITTTKSSTPSAITHQRRYQTGRRWLVARTTTLHFYAVLQTFTATNAAGQPITDVNAVAMAGDHVEGTSLDYVGNHKHHASSFSASGHSACTIESSSSELCNAQIAVGGSLLLSNNTTVTVDQNGSQGLINAGTGKYKSARGTESETVIGNNADVTITLTG